MNLIAQIPKIFQENGIQWLIIEEDNEDTKGVFLYCHKSLNESSEYDSWHENMESAQMQAETQWGVSRNDWHLKN